MQRRGLNRARQQAWQHAPVLQSAGGVGAQLNARASLAKGAGLLPQRHLPARLSGGNGRSQTTNATPNHTKRWLGLASIGDVHACGVAGPALSGRYPFGRRHVFLDLIEVHVPVHAVGVLVDDAHLLVVLGHRGNPPKLGAHRRQFG